MPGLNIKLNIEYLKTPQAILKIVQIITLLIAFSCITNCCDGGAPYTPVRPKYTGIRYDAPYWSYILRAKNPRKVLTESDLIDYNRNAAFFQAVTILGWLVVVFLFVLFFLSLHEKFNQFNWEMVSLVISTVWSVLLLLCCSLMGNISSTAYSVRFTINYSGFFKRYIDTMVTGVVFGFFALIAFIVEAAFLFWQFWSTRKAGNSSPPNNPAGREVFVSPGPSGSTIQNQTKPVNPPAQAREAPPKYETVPNLPGQTVPYATGQTVPYATRQTVPYATGQTVPYATGQTVPYATGQTVPYATGQTVPYATGQTVPYATGQTVPYATGQTVPYATGQTVLYSTGQAGQTAGTGQGIDMYPSGQQQYQTAPGQQPVQVGKKA